MKKALCLMIAVCGLCSAAVAQSEENVLAHKWAEALDLDSYGTAKEGTVVEFGVDLITGEGIYGDKLRPGDVWLVLESSPSILFLDALAGRVNSCSITCGDGYFSCCNISPLTGAECKCKKSDDTAKCSSGGPGSSSCSITETSN